MDALLAVGLPEPEFKMVFVVNMELEMGRGKQCAQVAHAALGLFLDIQFSTNDDDIAKLQQWLIDGQKKIVLKGTNLGEINRLKSEATAARLPNHLVADAGHTQISPGSKTVLAIFGSNQELDSITGSLRLL